MQKSELKEMNRRRSYQRAMAIKRERGEKPKKQETVEEFLARGGKIKVIPFGYSELAKKEQELMRRALANRKRTIKRLEDARRGNR